MQANLPIANLFQSADAAAGAARTGSAAQTMREDGQAFDDFLTAENAPAQPAARGGADRSDPNLPQGGKPASTKNLPVSENDPAIPGIAASPSAAPIPVQVGPTDLSSPKAPVDTPTTGVPVQAVGTPTALAGLESEPAASTSPAPFAAPQPSNARGWAPLPNFPSTTSPQSGIVAPADQAGPGVAGATPKPAGVPGAAPPTDAGVMPSAGKTSPNTGKSAPSANDIAQLNRHDAHRPLPAAVNLTSSTSAPAATGTETSASMPHDVIGSASPQPGTVAAPGDPLGTAAAILPASSLKPAAQPGVAGPGGKSAKVSDGPRATGGGPASTQPTQGLALPAATSAAGGAEAMTHSDEKPGGPGHERAAAAPVAWGEKASAHAALAKSTSGGSTAPIPSGQSQPAGTAEPRLDTAAQAQMQTPRDVALPMQAQLAQGTPLPAGGADVAQALTGGSDAEIATRAETELNLARAEARMSADRAAANMPRFTPHSATQLAGQISRNFNNGNRTFDIRLDPAELGKVDVRLEMRADNRVHAILTAERPETLAELQRSARDLERALNDAGLELSDEGLSFAMNDDEDASDTNEDGGSSLPIFTQSGDPGFTTGEQTPGGAHSAYGFLLSRRDSVDVRV